MRLPSFALGAALAVAALLAAQEAARDPQSGEFTFSLDVEVVNVLATVKDRDGRLVSDLTKDDFILTEDGVRQDIRYFAHETDLPLTVGLLVDTSGSQYALIPQERYAGALFFHSVLRPDSDLGFLIGFDSDVELLQDFTGSLQLLKRGLGALEFSLAAGVPPPVPTGGRRPTSTALYDAVFLAADEMLSDQAGRKAIVVISDGMDFGSIVSLQTAVEAVQRSDVVLYSIHYLDLNVRAPGYGSPLAGTGPLHRMASETGGSFFTVSAELPLTAVFQQIEEEMRSQYSIGYSPKREFAEPEFRKIELRTVQKGTAIQARSGYYTDAI